MIILFLIIFYIPILYRNFELIFEFIPFIFRIFKSNNNFNQGK